MCFFTLRGTWIQRADSYFAQVIKTSSPFYWSWKFINYRMQNILSSHLILSRINTAHAFISNNLRCTSITVSQLQSYVLNLVILLSCQTELLYTFVVLRKHSTSIVILLSVIWSGIFGETPKQWVEWLVTHIYEPCYYNLSAYWDELLGTLLSDIFHSFYYF